MSKKKATKSSKKHKDQGEKTEIEKRVFVLEERLGSLELKIEDQLEQLAQRNAAILRKIDKEHSKVKSKASNKK